MFIYRGIVGNKSVKKPCTLTSGEFKMLKPKVN